HRPSDASKPVLPVCASCVSRDLVDWPAQPILKLAQVGRTVADVSAQRRSTCATWHGEMEQEKGGDRTPQKHPCLLFLVRAFFSACPCQRLNRSVGKNLERMRDFALAKCLLGAC